MENLDKINKFFEGGGLDTSIEIECYSCRNGSTIESKFNLNVCPENWTIDENPCSNNTANSSIYSTPEGEKMGLNKELYKYKDVMNLLDLSFSEFVPKPQSTNNFFTIFSC